LFWSNGTGQCGGNSFFNTVSFLSGEYRVTQSSLALCSINDQLMRVTTSLTQGATVTGTSMNVSRPLKKVPQHQSGPPRARTGVMNYAVDPAQAMDLWHLSETMIDGKLPGYF
jgi:hypothetical protein